MEFEDDIWIPFHVFNSLENVYKWGNYGLSRIVSKINVSERSNRLTFNKDNIV